VKHERLSILLTSSLMNVSISSVSSSSVSSFTLDPASCSIEQLSLWLLSFGQTQHKAFKQYFSQEDLDVCVQYLTPNSQLLPPVPEIGFPADWALTASSFKCAVQCLRRDQADSYGGEGHLSAIDDFFASLEAAQIRVAAPTQSVPARTRRAKPAPATYRSPLSQSSSLSPPLPSPPPIMPTVLPKARDINLREVSTFDGSSANLYLFDTHIRNALKRWDIPLYHGGTIIGSEEEGFSFCHAAGTDQAESNYTLGEKPCSGLVNKFTGAADQW